MIGVSIFAVKIAIHRTLEIDIVASFLRYHDITKYCSESSFNSLHTVNRSAIHLERLKELQHWSIPCTISSPLAFFRVYLLLFLPGLVPSFLVPLTSFADSLLTFRRQFDIFAANFLQPDPCSSVLRHKLTHPAASEHETELLNALTQPRIPDVLLHILDHVQVLIDELLRFLYFSTQEIHHQWDIEE